MNVIYTYASFLKCDVMEFFKTVSFLNSGIKKLIN